MLRRLLYFSMLAGVFSQSHAQDHTLPAIPQNIAWGYYWGGAKPAVTIKSGETVKIQTLASCGDDKALAREGVPVADIPKYIAPIHEQVKEKGPGGHILTGPVAVQEAEVGDVLEVEVLKIDLDANFACNHFRPGAGFIPNEYPYSGSKIIPLDRAKMVANFAPGVVIPLHPFFGSMGVAPGPMRINSAPPWMHGGNMDNKELVEGSKIFYPVLSKGALFEAGDGHAGQGNGEVDITAMETFLSGTFRFTVHKGGQRLLWPRAETATHYISMGFSPDLKEAATIALRNMIEFLQTDKHLSRDDAYMLTSVACDMDVTEVVDGNDGVHMMCPKNIFVGK